MTTPKKPVRRVRVIEIVDEDGTDLDEATLNSLIAAADASADVADGSEDGDAADERASGKAAESTAPAEDAADDGDTDTVKGGAREASDETAGTGDDTSDEKTDRAARELAKGGSTGGRAGSAVRAAGRLVPGLVAAVVVLAVLAVVGLVQWRSAAGEEAERRDLVARVSAFGDVMATFSYRDVESAHEKTLAFLTGDARAEREKLDLKAFGDRLAEQKADLRSKSYAVYVGRVDGNLASAVLVFDLSIEAPALSQSQTIGKSHLTLGLIKVDGTWMISSMTPAGSEDSAASSVPGVGTPAPADTPTAKPTDKKE
ncbi:hypothetical protein LO762_19935 [Actinocorallia sp. API 0066]|uniref:hypothetical protein n=1 Tax=Actinocorallia sp. API 0066 TaxID=2896846 RepID=UPI001E29833A|nr:hypothetical protein [Actinocorallia sp. API 0066]MCD0451449.1 hypothetical protein [Actinocorallia sp. API 0066]